MSNSMAGRGDVDIDLPRLGLAIWERRNWLVGLTAGAGLLAFLLSSSIAPLYRAESRILIEDRPAVGETAGAATTGVLDAEAIASQVEVIRSSDLIAQVVEDLDLGARSEFDPASAPSILGDLLVLVGLADNPLDESSATRVVAAVREKLQVYQVQNSRVIAIEFSSEDAQLSADVANAFAETYLAVQSGAKLESSTGAASLLEPEIAALADRVRAAEERVADFRAENGLFMVGDNNSLAQRQLGDVSAELARVRGERANAQARARNARSAIEAGRSVDTIGGALDSTLIQRLREREIAVQSEIADLSTTLLDNHPRIRGLRSQLADLDAQIRAEIAKAVESLEGDAAVAALREEELVAQMNTIKASSAEAGSEEVQLRALEREAAAERQLLETYLNSARRASSLTAVGALPADARIITRATVPVEPYFPKTMVIVTVAMVSTALLFSIIVLLAELMSGRGLRTVGPGDAARSPTGATSTTFSVDGARFAEDMPYRISTPVVSQVAPVVPAAAAATAAVVSRRSSRRPQIDAAVLADLDRTAREIENSRLPVSEIRAAEAKRQAEPVKAVFLPEPPLVSPHPAAAEEDVSVAVVAETLMARRIPVVACLSPEGDAGSLGSVQLARFLAACGLQPLLVDMTASAVPTRAMAGMASEPGITDLLSGGISIADAIHADLHSHADFIPVGGADPATAMRAVARLPMIIEALSNAYDMVVIECGDIDVESLRRLTGSLDTATVLSIVEPSSETVEPTFSALLEDGRHDTLVMMVEDADGADHRAVSAA